MFVSSAPILRYLPCSPLLQATCRRPRAVVCATADGSDGSDPSERASLPQGSAASKSSNRADLGFVGADRIGISFVCTADNCNTRVSKSVRRLSYEKGTVIIRCPTCLKHHVIADNKNMYSQLTGGNVNIEQIARAKGETVTRVDDTVFNLEDMFGTFPHLLSSFSLYQCRPRRKKPAVEGKGVCVSFYAPLPCPVVQWVLLGLPNANACARILLFSANKTGNKPSSEKDANKPDSSDSRKSLDTPPEMPEQ